MKKNISEGGIINVHDMRAHITREIRYLFNFCGLRKKVIKVT